MTGEMRRVTKEALDVAVLEVKMLMEVERLKNIVMQKAMKEARQKALATEIQRQRDKEVEMQMSVEGSRVI
jgi:ribosomal silencing factor RsfS